MQLRGDPHLGNGQPDRPQGRGAPATPLPTETVLGLEGLCRPLSLLWKALCGQAPGRHGEEEGEDEEGEEEEEEEEGLHPGLQLCPAPSSLEPALRAALSGVRSRARGRVRPAPSWASGGICSPPSPASPNSNKPLPFFLSGCKEEQEQES